MKINEIAPSIRTIYNTFPTGTWANATWDIVAQMVEAAYEKRIYLSDFWKIGDTRTVHIDEIPSDDTKYAVNHPAQDIQLTILDFNKDQLAVPYKGRHWSVMTVGMTNTLSETYNVAGATLPDSSQVITTNDIHWKNSIYQSWCNNNFYSALPDGLKALTKDIIHPNMNIYFEYHGSQGVTPWTVLKKSCDSTTTEKCWFLDFTEFAENSGYTSQDGCYPLRYKYYKDNPSVRLPIGATTSKVGLDSLFIRSYTYNNYYGKPYHLGAQRYNNLNQYISVTMAF